MAFYPPNAPKAACTITCIHTLVVDALIVESSTFEYNAFTDFRPIMLFKKIYHLGDRFEDRVRARLSHFPLIYAAFGGAGMIIFWRGIWHTADFLMEYFFVAHDNVSSASIGALPWWDGPLSIAVGMTMLLSMGLFVTSFIGDAIIISGLKSDKKLTEKTEDEILKELQENERIHCDVHEIERRVRHIEATLMHAKVQRKSASVRRKVRKEVEIEVR